MLELAWLNTRKSTRTVLTIGHGLPHHGQLHLITLVREDMSPQGDIVSGTLLWAGGPVFTPTISDYTADELAEFRREYSDVDRECMWGDGTLDDCLRDFVSDLRAESGNLGLC